MTTTTTIHPASDTGRLSFSISARHTTYGDNQLFFEYRILMRLGKRIVGVESGPRRETADRPACLKAARARIRELKRRRLFAVDVSVADIRNGVGHSCTACAIAQALWRNQERIGLPRYQYDFNVAPYACMVETYGIALIDRRKEWNRKITGEDGMPDVVIPWRRHREGFYVESMQEWAMNFDEWCDYQGLSRDERKEENDRRGNDDDYYPTKPAPGSFVLDLDSFQPERDDEITE